MNVYDSERMEDVLAPMGFAISGEAAEADLLILNTCHIREKAAEKVYSDIGRFRILKEAAKSEGRNMIIAVAGCVAQAEGEEILNRAPAVDIVVGPQTYHRLPALVKKATEARRRGIRQRYVDTEFPASEKFDRLPQASGRSAPTAFLTIQEGCDKFCTFCVVPYTRGTEISRPVAEVLTEAQHLAAQGAREITLLGQNVNAYHGRDEKGRETGLGDLIRRTAEIDGIERLRYTTSHPRDMDESLISAHREVAECMPYLHLPVQSGSDRVLQEMNRRHSSGDYLRTIDKLRAARPDIAISGDFIVGFPGESDDEFEATLGLVAEVEYAQAYSFKYSPRPGTPAAESENQVPESVKAERLARLQELLNKQQMKFNEASLGRRMKVLLERRGKQAGQLVGRSPYMQAVHVEVLRREGKPPGETLDEVSEAAYSSRIGKIVEVEIVSAGPNSLRGRCNDVSPARTAA
jgi:tRNA-2-methylthio-N6-dimethylallyladenosine synthase